MLWSKKVKGFLMLTRPHNLGALVITTLIGWLSVAIELRNTSILNPLYPICTVVLIAAGGYAINDYFDSEIDAINKPYRPIPSGAVTRREALTFSLLLGIVGAILALPSGPVTTLFAVLNGLLIYYYSYRIKVWGFAGNVVVAFEGAASIIYGSLAVSEYVSNIGLTIS
jgi:geranylgeranylglycerol-phosphate geranylgeranyltransferase